MLHSESVHSVVKLDSMKRERDIAIASSTLKHSSSIKRSDSDKRCGSVALSKKDSYKCNNGHRVENAEAINGNGSSTKSSSSLAKRDSEREKERDKEKARRLSRVPELASGSGTPTRGETSFLDTTISSFARFFRTPSFKARRDSVAVSWKNNAPNCHDDEG